MARAATQRGEGLGSGRRWSAISRRPPRSRSHAGQPCSRLVWRFSCHSTTHRRRACQQQDCTGTRDARCSAARRCCCSSQAHNKISSMPVVLRKNERPIIASDSDASAKAARRVVGSGGVTGEFATPAPGRRWPLCDHRRTDPIEAEVARDAEAPEEKHTDDSPLRMIITAAKTVSCAANAAAHSVLRQSQGYN